MRHLLSLALTILLGLTGCARSPAQAPREIAAPSDFSLQVRTLDAGTNVWIDLEQGRLSVRRFVSIAEGQTVGVFQTVLTTAELNGLHGALTSADWEPPAPVNRGSPIVRIVVHSGGRGREVVTPLHEMKPPAGLVLHALDRYTDRVTPLRAFRLALSPSSSPPSSGKPTTMPIALVNVGTQPIELDLEGRLSIRAAHPPPPPEPGITPLPVIATRIAETQVTRATVRLAPGECKDMPVKATFPEGGTFFVGAKLDAAVTLRSPGEEPLKERVELLSNRLTVSLD